MDEEDNRILDDKREGVRFVLPASIVETREVARDIFITRLRCAPISSAILAGQFVMLSFPGMLVPLLPRAFSVSDVHGDVLSLFYLRLGRGTNRLASMRQGEEVILNGPLGNGFPAPLPGTVTWCIVGGSGAAIIPLVHQAHLVRNAGIRFFYGARTKDQIYDFKFDLTLYSTDDGSFGYHGTVLNLARTELEKNPPDRIFACGPTAMLSAVQREFRGKIPTYLSLETPMACGTGLCQGCPVESGDGSVYFLACKNGPVFEAGEIGEIVTDKGL